MGSTFTHRPQPLQRSPIVTRPRGRLAAECRAPGVASAPNRQRRAPDARERAAVESGRAARRYHALGQQYCRRRCAARRGRGTRRAHAARHPPSAQQDRPLERVLPWGGLDAGALEGDLDTQRTENMSRCPDRRLDRHVLPFHEQISRALRSSITSPYLPRPRSGQPRRFFPKTAHLHFAGAVVRWQFGRAATLAGDADALRTILRRRMQALAQNQRATPKESAPVLQTAAQAPHEVQRSGSTASHSVGRDGAAAGRRRGSAGRSCAAIPGRPGRAAAPRRAGVASKARRPASRSLSRSMPAAAPQHVGDAPPAAQCSPSSADRCAPSRSASAVQVDRRGRPHGRGELGEASRPACSRRNASSARRRPGGLAVVAGSQASSSRRQRWNRNSSSIGDVVGQLARRHRPARRPRPRRRRRRTPPPPRSGAAGRARRARGTARRSTCTAGRPGR